MSGTKLGVVYMLTGSFLFAVTMAFAKLLSHSMGAVEVTFWRNIVGLIIVLWMVWRNPMQNRGGMFATLIFRGIIGTAALIVFFYTIGATSLSSAVVYAKTEPIFTALLAFFILKERLGYVSIFAIVIGFIGIAVLGRFEIDSLQVIGVMTGFLAALAYTSVRSLKGYYDEKAVVLSFMGFGTIIPLVLMMAGAFYKFPFIDDKLAVYVSPQGLDWLWIVMMGSFAALAQIFMTKAYYAAPAGIVSAASYSVVLFATIFGIMLGDIYPSSEVLIGGALIILSGVLLVYSK
ncbi:MAG: DMT family transporter [Sulfurovaceae bacterium]|nr:DMT family transporter [Sulfurovaceae bacterium]